MPGRHAYGAGDSVTLGKISRGLPHEAPGDCPDCPCRPGLDRTPCRCAQPVGPGPGAVPHGHAAGIARNGCAPGRCAAAAGLNPAGDAQQRRAHHPGPAGFLARGDGPAGSVARHRVAAGCLAQHSPGFGAQRYPPGIGARRQPPAGGGELQAGPALHAKGRFLAVGPCPGHQCPGPVLPGRYAGDAGPRSLRYRQVPADVAGAPCPWPARAVGSGRFPHRPYP